MFELRPYQAEAVEAIIKHVKTSIMPAMIEAPTGSGKSVIIAEVARIIFEMTGKRILVTAPTAELVIQNRKKFLATGYPASMYSASAGAKSLKHPVVFGSPLTIKGNISTFKNNFAMIINDECDLVTPTIKSIIEQMREGNPNLRIIGTTATPYRMKDGYIFREWPDGRINGDDVANEPFYHKCVYRIEARYLIDQNYLTKPRIGSINSENYDTSGLVLNRMGRFDSASVDRAFVGMGRKTAHIVGDIVNQSRDRNAVLIFASTVRHAEEVMASLPPSISAIVTGETKNRKEILQAVSDGKIKYVVNVGVLTVGVDLPIVDVIALLRKSESVRLLQQIIGRGLRLYDGKEDCLILDYAGNIEEMAPDGDIFSPIVRASKSTSEAIPLKAKCEHCSYVNEFTCNPEYLDYKKDENGYCLDVFGNRIETDYGPLPGHYGRRCWGYIPAGLGKMERCGYYWTSRECDACGGKNDIAARRCRDCGAEIIDPNEKLIGEFKAHKRDPHLPQCDEVISMTVKPSISRAGNQVLRVDWVTPYRQFSTYFMVEGKTPRQQYDYKVFMDETNGGKTPPKTISYRKTDDKFFTIMGYNKPHDEEPVKEKVA